MYGTSPSQGWDGASSLVVAGAQLPPQEVNSWGPTLRFWGPSPKTPTMRVTPRFILFGLLALGCATPKVKLSEGPREYVATDYDTVLKNWTRYKEFTNVNVMDNVLSVTATYESWDFRWAYVVRYAEDYRLTVDQRHSLLERSLAETRDGHQFYVALYAQRYKWNDITAKDPAWIVRLIDD